MLLSLSQVLRRAELFTKHEVKFEPLSVRERMGDILTRVNRGDGFIAFNELFLAAEGRLGVVVTFLAIMELIRESLVDFVQAEPFAPIHVRVGKTPSKVFATTLILMRSMAGLPPNRHLLNRPTRIQTKKHDRRVLDG